ncbi:hypothetical protein B0H10DRAFT_1949370 [Mycena sp. CBHHK59/15]|nr:hypothetical protein B0H10DRAFT_1949370 [Mycena sp. CBHHK59/15]
MSVATTEVPYTKADIAVAKSVLIALVQRQVKKWPGGSGQFKPKHITAERISKVLVDPQYGFTKPSSTMENPGSPLSDSVSISSKHDSDTETPENKGLNATGSDRASSPDLEIPTSHSDQMPATTGRRLIRYVAWDRRRRQRQMRYCAERPGEGELRIRTFSFSSVFLFFLGESLSIAFLVKFPIRVRTDTPRLGIVAAVYAVETRQMSSVERRRWRIFRIS